MKPGQAVEHALAVRIAELVARDQRDEDEAHQRRRPRAPTSASSRSWRPATPMSTTSPAPSQVRTMTMPGPNERRYSKNVRGTGAAADVAVVISQDRQYLSPSVYLSESVREYTVTMQVSPRCTPKPLDPGQPVPQLVPTRQIQAHHYSNDLTTIGSLAERAGCAGVAAGCGASNQSGSTAGARRIGDSTVLGQCRDSLRHLVGWRSRLGVRQETGRGELLAVRPDAIGWLAGGISWPGWLSMSGAT